LIVRDRGAFVSKSVATDDMMVRRKRSAGWLDEARVPPIAIEALE